jgi:hypothetical protein
MAFAMRDRLSTSRIYKWETSCLKGIRQQLGKVKNAPMFSRYAKTQRRWFDLRTSNTNYLGRINSG